MEDNVYDPSIKSVKIIGGQDQLSYPIYYVNTSNYVYLSFDDLNEDRNLGYRIRYCNSDWTLSDLFYSEYIDGFQEEYLDDYEFSFNTCKKLKIKEIFILNLLIILNKNNNIIILQILS